MASEAMYGPPGGWPRSSRERLACAITAITWDDCCAKQAGVGNSRLSVPASATKKPSSSDRSSAGQPLKKSRTGEGNHRLGRRSRLLAAADGGAHLAPSGQTPVLQVPLTRDHLPSISGIISDGRLFLQVRPACYDAEAVVGFLRVLLRKIAGKVVVIWDGSPIHRAHEVKDFLQRGAAKRLHLEQLP